MLAFVGNTTPTPLSCARFFFLACSHRDELQHRQSFQSACSWTLCPTLLWGRWGRSGVDGEALTSLPSSRMSAAEM